MSAKLATDPSENSESGNPASILNMNEKNLLMISKQVMRPTATVVDISKTVQTAITNMCVNVGWVVSFVQFNKNLSGIEVHGIRLTSIFRKLETAIAEQHQQNNSSDFAVKLNLHFVLLAVEHLFEEVWISCELTSTDILLPTRCES